ncbi:hypothetical protein MCOR23_008674 [Pyricularia oryzae]|uniref:Uncharacterized protein n=1 Tax=Pyricularia oryzae TaxID=318829 RepID=A0A4P7N0J4_PYROR|nr:hypothetical protein MCOR30_010626 [Pyricularia oryzae]KAI6392022.1 hypothetical protein MCOR23_008674 [Pyricularia oryzae]KAI6498094.1 hypothetical protein MCOR11_004124 [Pyricularia oryzae]KAI6511043.1 hypothetical protein MCOR13_000729 [Pyricularia oryzae]QBZ55827.1 hypothetical protein PoMZ_00730 [Pyricularia oryzae]
MAVQRQRQCSVQTRRPSKLAQGRFIARPEELGTPVPPLGKLILKLKSEDLNDVSGGLETVASITNKSLVASFNWLDGDNSIILVPVLAALAMSPNLCGDEMLYPSACGSTMGSLVRMVFLIRKENSATELITGLQSYGHSFPEHYTAWEREVKGSKSHQRIDIETMPLSDEIQAWEAENKESLTKLAGLIHHTSDMVRDRQNGRLELCHPRTAAPMTRARVLESIAAKERRQIILAARLKRAGIVAAVATELFHGVLYAFCSLAF